jgi:hypothetical protein
MNQIICSLLCFGILLSCGENQVSKVKTNQNQMTGNDRNPHDCIGSAGYTWSVVKNRCIRIFEEGSPFFSYDQSSGAIDSTQVAYVVLSDDLSKAEVFFGNTDKPVVMDSLVVQEGETMPVLFENKIELLALKYYKDKYLLLYKDEIKYLQTYDEGEGLAALLKHK